MKRHLTPALSPTEAEREKFLCALCALLRPKNLCLSVFIRG